MSIDAGVWIAGTVAETAIIAILFQRRIARLLPVFTLYIIWGIVSDLAMAFAKRQYPGQYFQIYTVEMCVDSLLQFGVLVELSWSVLRPYRESLPRWTLVAIAGLILLLGIAIWPIAGITAMRNLPPQWHLLMRLQQTFVILRILFFLALAGFSQLLAIGWRNRELQVATGLGFYSLVTLGASLIQAQQASPAQFQLVSQIVAVSYVCSLLYWTFSFLQKEAPRQQFNPRMQNILLTVAGAARANRMAIDDIRKTKP